MEPYITETAAVQQLSLPGIPHNLGIRPAVNMIRSGLREVVGILASSGYADAHAVDVDRVACELIDLLDQLGPAELHAVRIAVGMLVRVARTNGYHHDSN
jgi:hypothetical protein